MSRRGDDRRERDYDDDEYERQRRHSHDYDRRRYEGYYDDRDFDRHYDDRRRYEDERYHYPPPQQRYGYYPRSRSREPDYSSRPMRRPSPEPIRRQRNDQKAYERVVAKKAKEIEEGWKTWQTWALKQAPSTPHDGIGKRLLVVSRSSGQLSADQMDEVEAANALQAATIRVELGFEPKQTMSVHVPARASTMAMPHVGRGGRTFAALNAALAKCRKTHLTLMIISPTGLSSEMDSLQAWAREVSDSVESLSLGFYTPTALKYKDLIEATLLEPFQVPIKNGAGFLSFLEMEIVLGRQPATHGSLVSRLRDFFVAVNMLKAGQQGQGFPKNRNKPVRRDLELLVEQMGAASMW